MIKFNQSSTWRGMALIASAIAAASGYGYLFSVALTPSGVEIAGIAGTAISAIIGTYDALRDESKGVQQ